MVAPSKFAHVVFNTHRYDEMIDWYARVFEARVLKWADAPRQIRG
jgi:catechol 2,3-dioxygenase-like lactoylglutathione lyase family enzyme